MLYIFGVGYKVQFTHRHVSVAIRYTVFTLVRTVSPQVVLYALKAANGTSNTKYYYLYKYNLHPTITKTIAFGAV